MARASLISNALGLTREHTNRSEMHTESTNLNEDRDAHRHESLEEDRRRNVLQQTQITNKGFMLSTIIPSASDMVFFVKELHRKIITF